MDRVKKRQTDVDLLAPGIEWPRDNFNVRRDSPERIELGSLKRLLLTGAPYGVGSRNGIVFAGPANTSSSFSKQAIVFDYSNPALFS